MGSYKFEGGYLNDLQNGLGGHMVSQDQIHLQIEFSQLARTANSHLVIQNFSIAKNQ